jgi:hypothetical protein
MLTIVAAVLLTYMTDFVQLRLRVRRASAPSLCAASMLSITKMEEQNFYFAHQKTSHALNHYCRTAATLRAGTCASTLNKGSKSELKRLPFERIGQTNSDPSLIIHCSR